ncbi:MAG: peptide deformylase [bacterium]|nr:peptide deformylase [bacterium]
MTIVIEPSPVLHQVAQPVTVFDDALKATVTTMRQTMHAANGMGLAAPQVGLSQQLCIIEYLPKDGEGKLIEADAIAFFALANPKITWQSAQQITMTEGCLSLPGLEGEVTRPKRLRVKGQDETGNKLVIKASGMLARILQHEIDHLNGVLYDSKLNTGTQLRPAQPDRKGV